MPRSTLWMLPTYIGLFLVPGIVGVTLAEWLAPGSWLAATVGMFAMPLAFGLCMTVWYGVAVAWLLLKLPAMLAHVIAAARSDQPTRPQISRSGEIPGTFVFLPICTAAGVIAGVLIAIVPASTGLLAPIGCYVALGVTLGVLMRSAARAGLLVPPHEL